jgi:hypothetical protein
MSDTNSYGTVESELYECAAQCERAGYSVQHVDPDSNTGVLLEAHPKYNTIEDAGMVVIQWTGDIVSVTLPSKTTKTHCTLSACEILLENL